MAQGASAQLLCHVAQIRHNCANGRLQTQRNVSSSTVAKISLEACQGHAENGEVDEAFRRLDAGTRQAAVGSSCSILCIVCMPALPALGEQALPTPSAARRVDAPFFGTECRQLKCDVHARAKRGGDLTDNYALDLLYHTTIRIRTKRLARRHAQLRRLCNEVHSDHHAFRKRLRARSGDVPNSSSLCNRGMPTVRRLQTCSCQTLQSCHPFPSPCNWLLLSIALSSAYSCLP